MGRKGNFTEKPKSGPGKKTKKQKAPEFTSFLPKSEDDSKVLSSNQRARAKKRALKAHKSAEKEFKKKTINKSEDASDSGDSGCDLPMEPSKRKKSKTEIFPSDSENEEFEMVGKLKPSGMDVSGSEDDKDEYSDEGSDAENDDDDDEERNDIEKQSEKLDEEKKRLEAENEEELASQKVQVEIPTLEQVQKELEESPDLPTVSLRIKDLAFILTDFRSRCEDGRTRKEYLEILEHDLCAYYSYNKFLIQKVMEIFSVTELLDFLEANEAPRPVTIRTNTLKTRRKQLAQSLIAQGVNLDTIPWSKVGMVIYSSGAVALGATTEYLAGHYLLQGASSFLPVVSLAPKENERVLDMCAAPGGKSTHIAAMMRNTGILFSNDFNKERTKALIGNFHRMGISNAVITSVDGRKYPKMLSRAFDRCLLDAPCSGTGVISKDEKVKMSKDAAVIKRCSHLQRELLLAAIDCVDANSKTGGYICYSTCSILLEENEEVVNYAMKKRSIKIVPAGLDIGKEGFTTFKEKQYHTGMSLCRRIYPHSNNMDGFFIVKLKKLSNDIPKPEEKGKDPKEMGNKKKKKAKQETLPVESKESDSESEGEINEESEISTAYINKLTSVDSHVKKRKRDSSNTSSKTTNEAKKVTKKASETDVMEFEDIITQVMEGNQSKKLKKTGAKEVREENKSTKGNIKLKKKAETAGGDNKNSSSISKPKIVGKQVESEVKAKKSVKTKEKKVIKGKSDEVSVKKKLNRTSSNENETKIKSIKKKTKIVKTSSE